MIRLFALALVAWPLLARAEARTSDLEKAARQLNDGKHEQAVRTLEAAWKQSSNRRETVLRILELQGAAYTLAGHEAKARLSFQTLLALDPKRELGSRYGSKVLKAFDDAKALETPALELTAEPAAIDPGGKVAQIAVKVKNDALKLVRKVRFTVRPESGKWAEAEVELQGAYAATGTDAAGVEWYAELLGEREMVLAVAGTRAAPVKEGTLREVEPSPPPPPRKEEPPPKPEEPKPVLKEEVEPSRGEVLSVRRAEPLGNGSPALRAVGYSALGLGFAALAAGTVMGVLWRSTTGELQRKLDGATYVTVNGVLAIDTLPGVPRGQAQSYYLSMLDRARTEAIAANVLWSVGGGLAIAGLILYFVGRDTIPDVSPGGGGLIVAW